MRRWVLGILAISMGIAVVTLAGTAAGGSAPVRVVHDAAAGTTQPARLAERTTGPDGQVRTVTKRLPSISAGTLQSAADSTSGPLPPGAHAQAAAAAAGPVVPGLSAGTLGCGERTSLGNARVNQDCGFRLQSEEGIAYNPVEPTNLVAGMNDERQGRNQCGIAFSLDAGRRWGDGLPPFQAWANAPDLMLPTPADPNRNTILGDPGTLGIYQRASDPAMGFDSRGRAYFSCVTFDSNTNASGVFVTASPAGAKASYFFNIDTGTQPDNRPINRKFKVVEDNSPLAFHDKEFIAVDSFPSSPNRDNVYVTWTVFRMDDQGNYQRAPIFGSMSTDGALTWSTPEEISGNSSTLCFFGDAFDPSQSPHQCDFDQGADPVVLPNGQLEVVFNNDNTPAGNPNAQQLGVHCAPSGSSTAGTAHLNCAAPTKVGDDVVSGEPVCDFGRGAEQCIPGNFIRTDDFPRIAVSRANGHLYAAWQDYRNGEYDIQLAGSTDGGMTWTPSRPVNATHNLDHYEPAVAVSPAADGSTGSGLGSDRVGVSYYRTGRVPDENTQPAAGFAPGQPGVQDRASDYALAGGTGASTSFAAVTVSPSFPPPGGDQFGFLGDYSGLTITPDGAAHPIWADTRNADPLAPANGVVNDEDVFTDALSVPGGQASVTTLGCSPASVTVGRPSTCTATVTGGVHPTGTVSFNTNSSGTFSAPSCTLVQIGGNQARCSVTYTPRAVGTGSHKIYANYSGDAANAPSAASTTINVT
jgi:hypothetical protein